MKKLLYLLSLTLIFVYFIIKGDVVSESLFNALLFCGKTVIPQLFFYLCFSELFMQSGIVEKIISTFPRFGAEISAFLVGMLSGFPSGAITTQGLYEKGVITRKRGEYILAFSNNVSVSFLLGFVALVVGKTGAAAVLLCQILFSVLFAVVGRFFLSENDLKISLVSDCKNEMNISRVIINSVKRATANMINICGIILFFTAFNSVFLQKLPALSGYAELTGGIATLKNLPFEKRLFYASSYVGFCGLCVGFQIASVCTFDMKKYVTSKIVCAFSFPFVVKIIYGVIL